MDKARARAKYAELEQAGKADLLQRSPAARYAPLEDDPAFTLWMHNVNIAVARRAGIGVFDLADIPFRDLFEDGVDSSEAAAEALASDDLAFQVYDA